MKPRNPRNPTSPKSRDFEQFRLLYPPRAVGAIPPSEAPHFRGWIAQYKYHDVRTLVYFFPDGHLELFNRTRQPLGIYSLTAGMNEDLHRLKLRQGFFHVLDGGLMHAKTRRIRDRLILWDILVHDSQYLLGTTYLERYTRLASVCGNPTAYERETGDQLALRVNKHVWLAPTFTRGLARRYAKLIHLDEVEGLMLKDPRGKLERGIRERNNGSWQIRVRKSLWHEP